MNLGKLLACYIPANSILVNQQNKAFMLLINKKDASCLFDGYEYDIGSSCILIGFKKLGLTRKTSLSTSNYQQFEAISEWPLVHILIICLVLLSSLTTGHSANEPDVEGEALIELRKALNDSANHISNWDYYLVSPCVSWSHVTCRNGSVISLSLDSIELSGTLSPAITTLTHLSRLELQNNHLSGPLPDYLGDMIQLEYLNLANNHVYGSIPRAWGQLSNLKHLDLSANNLSGEIPMQLLKIPMFNFTGTNLSCGATFEAPCISSPPLKVSSRKSSLAVIAASVSCSALILLLLGSLFVCRYQTLQRLRKDIFVDVAGEHDPEISFGQLRRFSWREMQLATDNFSESNIIGQGGFGKVYRGVLSDNTKVAVKCLADYQSPGGEAAFHREIQLISAAVHKNLLKLIGFCTTSSERILVYPYMQNLSVAYRLRDLKPGEKGLDWQTRIKIAFGTAHGLEYLHEQCDPKIIHRDLKAANILLDDNFEAVLGDFGLAKLVDPKLTHVTTQVRGTMGHIAPEYLSTGKSSEKTDVFGYGITLLELVTGQRAIDLSRLEEEEDVLLLDHIRKVLRENRLNYIMDDNLKSFNREEVETMVQVALLCTQSLPEDRPTMSQVVQMLQGVGLAERWAKWEQLEETRNHDLSLFPHHYVWTEDSSVHQEAIQLSKAR